MDYTLQPGLKTINDKAVPEYKADQHIFAWPQATNTNTCCRPSTVVMGTAPYMAGGGAPNHLVSVEDSMRPQSTTVFNKSYTEQAYDFPNKSLPCEQTQRTRSFDPASTRGEVQNGLFLKRYCNSSK